jgi:hypothetical protein
LIDPSVTRWYHCVTRCVVFGEDFRSAKEPMTVKSGSTAGWANFLEGMLEGFSLGTYLLLVDYTGRLFREGKTAISREIAAIFERLGTSAETWQARLEKLSQGRLLGRFFAASRQRLREVAEPIGPAPRAESGRMSGGLKRA